MSKRTKCFVIYPTGKKVEYPVYFLDSKLLNCGYGRFLKNKAGEWVSIGNPDVKAEVNEG
jgi:hypothetical protein